MTIFTRHGEALFRAIRNGGGHKSFLGGYGYLYLGLLVMSSQSLQLEWTDSFLLVGCIHHLCSLFISGATPSDLLTDSYSPVPVRHIKAMCFFVCCFFLKIVSGIYIHMSCFGPDGTPVSDFWWHLFWVSALLACFCGVWSNLRSWVPPLVLQPANLLMTSIAASHFPRCISRGRTGLRFEWAITRTKG